MYWDGVHAAAQLVAALPERGVEVGFAEGHGGWVVVRGSVVYLRGQSPLPAAGTTVKEGRGDWQVLRVVRPAWSVFVFGRRSTWRADSRSSSSRSPAASSPWVIAGAPSWFPTARAHAERSERSEVSLVPSRKADANSASRNVKYTLHNVNHDLHYREYRQARKARRTALPSHRAMEGSRTKD